jgi:hypothetical protein
MIVTNLLLLSIWLSELVTILVIRSFGGKFALNYNVNASIGNAVPQWTLAGATGLVSCTGMNTPTLTYTPASDGQPERRKSAAVLFMGY